MQRSFKFIPVICLGLTLACSENTKFKGNPEQASPPKSAETLPAATLAMTVPVNEIRSGKKTLQAKAIVKNAERSAVKWTLEGPAGVDVDVGTIDKKGLFTSPEALKATIDVVIKATLASDDKIFDSKTVKVVPAENPFVGCSAGSEVFPIKADVYRVPKDSQQLPDFATASDDKLSTVCMDQYNVPEREFDAGFPGVEGLNEWFALHTTGKINIKTAGEYTFRLTSDDGSMLYIDGSTVVDNNGLHSAMAREGSILLTAGPHDFVLDYYQGPANRIALQLFWQIPGSTDFVIVPSDAFAK